ncbi:ribonuclease H-like domain-containing protein [Tanacetum coccineum]|uniref:Ribonuclease H-like domain-containing protein n=1 Tax=Tanacetum coccineum TaxID=301880 RepID=A0ABQ5F0F7_9ASTR
MVPRAVLMRTGLKTVKNAKPLSTARSVNTVRPVSTARFVNTVRPYNTAHPKPTVSWHRPKTIFKLCKKALLLQEYSFNKESNYQLNEKGFVDSGCSRHMSGNIAHLSDFKEFDGGFVTFGGGANGGRITGKVPKDGLTCLVAKATSEESMLWHRRLGHVNFKNINKLVKDNLVRIALKQFKNDKLVFACLKRKST